MCGLRSCLTVSETMNIYVGNLAWKTTRKDLRELFENFGEVNNAFIVRDKKTRRSRGFGFVEMALDDDARQAIEKLNNTVFLDRTILVNEAQPRQETGNGEEEDYAGAGSESGSQDLNGGPPPDSAAGNDG